MKTDTMTAEQLATYQELTQELRCVVCQNQTIADSSAPIAQDLRNQVAQMLTEQSADKTQILQFMVERYGDAILYTPPVQGNTILLWVGPALLLITGVVMLWQFVRQQSKEPMDD